jgi:hypothetical protein
MPMMTKTLLTLSTSLCLAQMVAAESALSFVDLRVHGGIAQTDGTAGHVTLMAGDLGNKDQHVITIDADMGIVLGFRGTVMETIAKRDDNSAELDLKLGGGAIVGGLGFIVGKSAHMELCGGYGQGVGTLTGDTPWDYRDSRYKTYLAELGWYYTDDSGIQFGLIVGYSVVKVTYNDVNTTVKAEVKGFDGSISLGFRF